MANKNKASNFTEKEFTRWKSEHEKVIQDWKNSLDEADKKNVLPAGNYVFTTNDPFHKEIKKGASLEIKKDIKSDESALGMFVFFVTINGKRLGITKDMIKPSK